MRLFVTLLPPFNALTSSAIYFPPTAMLRRTVLSLNDTSIEGL